MGIRYRGLFVLFFINGIIVIIFVGRDGFFGIVLGIEVGVAVEYFCLEGKGEKKRERERSRIFKRGGFLGFGS